MRSILMWSSLAVAVGLMGWSTIPGSPSQEAASTAPLASETAIGSKEGVGKDTDVDWLAPADSSAVSPLGLSSLVGLDGKDARATKESGASKQEPAIQPLAEPGPQSESGSSRKVQSANLSEGDTLPSAPLRLLSDSWTAQRANTDQVVTASANDPVAPILPPRDEESDSAPTLELTPPRPWNTPASQVRPIQDYASTGSGRIANDSAAVANAPAANETRQRATTGWRPVRAMAKPTTMSTNEGWHPVLPPEDRAMTPGNSSNQASPMTSGSIVRTSYYQTEPTQPLPLYSQPSIPTYPVPNSPPGSSIQPGSIQPGNTQPGAALPGYGGVTNIDPPSASTLPPGYPNNAAAAPAQPRPLQPTNEYGATNSTNPMQPQYATQGSSAQPRFVTGEPFVTGAVAPRELQYVNFNQGYVPCGTPYGAPAGALQGQRVPGVIAPPTLTPNQTPAIYSPDNAGFLPLFTLGQEDYNVQLGRGLIGQPVAYVPGQPVRNFFRYLFP